MRARVSVVVGLLCVAVLLASSSDVSIADTPAPPPISAPQSQGFPAPPALLGANGRMTVMLQLSGAPAITAADAPAVAALSVQNTAEQDALVPALAALDAQIIFRTRLGYNGIALSVPLANVAALRALPGVQAVHSMLPKQPSPTPDPLAATRHQQVIRPETVTGAAVKIAVIDSGIDYTHADFGGPGTPEAYFNPNRVFPTAKVVGGYDFAGDNYDASGQLGSPVPAPDADPLDCNGHGTQVASLAAGFGVTDAGATYGGPYPPPNEKNFRIPPGTAPEAQLLALKVFGCAGGTTDLVTLAIERALELGADVINLSLGTPFGGADDPDAVAADNAVRAGRVVVAAVGDGGGTFYSTATPASGQRVIAVGASQLDAAGLPVVRSQSARGPQRGGASKPDLIALGDALPAAAFATGNGEAPLSNTSAATAQVSGAAALLRQQYPDWRPEQIKAALINTATAATAPNGANAPPSLAGGGQLNLAQLNNVRLLAYANDPQQPVALVYGAPHLSGPWSITRPVTIENTGERTSSVRLTSVATITETGVTMAVPSNLMTLPPRSSASVSVTLSFDPTSFAIEKDGATELLQDGFLRYFDYERGGYIQAETQLARLRVINASSIGSVRVVLDEQTLVSDLESSGVSGYGTNALGDRFLRVFPAGSSTSVLRTMINLPSRHNYSLIISGSSSNTQITLVDDTPRVRPPAGLAQIRYVNASVSSGPLNVSFDGSNVVSNLGFGDTSAAFDIAPGSHRVRFLRGGSTYATKDITVDAGDLVLAGAGDGSPHAFAGFGVSQGPPGGVRAIVPYAIFPQLASASQAVTTTLSVPAGATQASLALVNSGARTADPNSTQPGTRAPLVAAFELATIDAPLDDPALPVAADVKVVGVTNNFSITQNVEETRLFFGLASYRAWSTPNEVQFLVYFDTTGPAGVPDGVDDFVLLNTSLGAVQAPFDSNDVLWSLLYPVDPVTRAPIRTISGANWNSLPPAVGPYEADVAPFNTSVMFMPVRAGDIGLSAGHTRFNYHVETRARDAGNFSLVVDRVPAAGSPDLSYDMALAPIAPINGASRTVPLFLGQRPLFVDDSGQSVTFAVNPAALQFVRTTNLLLLHQHNAPASQVEIVTVNATP